MDFRSRGVQPHVAQAQQPASHSTNNAGGAGNHPGQQDSGKNKWFSRGESVLLVLGALLIAIIALLLFLGGPSQAKAVKNEGYQAVFLNNGQVYFGKISELNDNFIDLRNIYYLQTSGTGQGQEQAQSNSNVSLVKLGCELHAPFDQMVINYDQVIFWENLQDGSQVVKAINDYKKQNPKGQTCSAQSQNSTQQAPATNNSETEAVAPTAEQAAPTTKPQNARP